MSRSRLTPSCHRSNFRVEQLEDRAVPAATFVNDNWHLFQDVNNDGKLSVGDLVSTANDPGSLSVYTYGTQAFGTVTTGSFTGPHSLSGYATINDAVAAAGTNGTVNVLAGTYVEDVNLNQAGVSLLGAGPTLSIISGAIGGDSATIHVNASNVTVAGLEITREGDNPTDWNNANLNSAGIAIQGQAFTGTLIHDNLITGNRTGIDVNNSNGHTIRNNVITNNRTGLIFRNQTDNLLVTQNVITNNFTLGIVFLDGSLGSNTPPQQALNSQFFNNNISGNWYGQIVDRQNGGSLPAPGTNVKDFSGNWFGTANPVITSADSSEPGYSSQIPVQFGGTAQAPGGQPDIAGPASANFDINPLLSTGTDTNVETTPGWGTYGFQGDFSQLTATTQLAQTGITGRIQEGVNLVTAGGTITASDGTYTENVTINKTLTLLSASGQGATTIQGVSGVGALGTVVVAPNVNNAVIGNIGHGFTIVGIDNDNPAVENAALYYQGNHNGGLVAGNDIRANGDDGLLNEYGTTFTGLVIDHNIFSGQTFTGTNPAGSGFANQFSLPNVPRQLVVIGNGSGDAASATATNITFTNNQITGTTGGLTTASTPQGNTLVTIDAANSTITGNTFAGTTTADATTATQLKGVAALRIRRPGTTVSGNTFLSTGTGGGTGMGVGTDYLFVQNNTTPLQSIVAANTFDRGAYVDNGNNVSTAFTRAATLAADGSTLRVLAGIYPEGLDLTSTGIDKALTVSPDAGPVVINGNLKLDSNDQLVIDENGTTPGAALDQIQVNGTVTLTDASLTLRSTTTVAGGTAITLINNDGTDTVTNTFAGLDEGATVTASNGQKFTISYKGGTGNDVVLVAQTPPSVAPPATVQQGSSAPAPVHLFAVTGPNGMISVYNSNGSLRVQGAPLGSLATDIRVATGDINGDGVDDIILAVGSGPLQGLVMGVDGATLASLGSFYAFPGIHSGVNVAIGDVTGDGRNDLVFATASGMSLVQAYDLSNGKQVANFVAFPGLASGATVAVANVDGVGAAEIIVGVASNGPPIVAEYNTAGQVLDAFLAYPFPYNGGINVTAGDVLGTDGKAEILVGPATGGAFGMVELFASGNHTPVAAASMGLTSPDTGLRVAIKDVDGNGSDDVLFGAGPGGSRVLGFDLRSSALLLNFDAFLPSANGVYVG